MTRMCVFINSHTTEARKKFFPLANSITTSISSLFRFLFLRHDASSSEVFGFFVVVVVVIVRFVCLFFNPVYKNFITLRIKNRTRGRKSYIRC